MSKKENCNNIQTYFRWTQIGIAGIITRAMVLDQNCMGILVGRVKHWGLRVRVKMTAKEQFSGWGLIVAQKSVPMFACF